MYRKLALALLCLCLPLTGAQILMVADEIPAMEVLARQLKTRAGADAAIATQDKLPAALADYSAVLVYIHKSIGEPAEKAFIEYARGGGKLILLHHSISSGKRQNREWLPFLNIELPGKPYAEGGYKYFDPADFDVLDLAPGNYITTHDVEYPEKVEGKPAFAVKDTEVYLNHEFTGPRTTLLGIRYKDLATGKLYEQATAGWYRSAGKGLTMYFMVGHNARDFDNPSYAQILANAVTFRP